MEKQALMKKAYERIRADYDTLEKKWLEKDQKALIGDAYYMACVNEAFCFLENELLSEDCVFDEKKLNNIINFNHGNFLDAFYDEWLNYDNEYHNLFYWGDLNDMMTTFINRKDMYGDELYK